MKSSSASKAWQLQLCDARRAANCCKLLFLFLFFSLLSEASPSVESFPAKRDRRSSACSSFQQLEAFRMEQCWSSAGAVMERWSVESACKEASSGASRRASQAASETAPRWGDSVRLGQRNGVEFSEIYVSWSRGVRVQGQTSFPQPAQCLTIHALQTALKSRLRF